jgi:hypothetical protein
LPDEVSKSTRLFLPPRGRNTLHIWSLTRGYALLPPAIAFPADRVEVGVAPVEKHPHEAVLVRQDTPPHASLQGSGKLGEAVQSDAVVERTTAGGVYDPYSKSQGPELQV